MDMDEIQYRCLSSEILRLSILPTEQCNLRCIYCYEDFAMGRMSEDTIEKLIKFIESRAPQLKFLHISWFGGEPSIAFDIIEKITSRVILIEQKYGFNFYASMTTNFFRVTPEMFIYMDKSSKSQYQVSLDGPQKFHDKTRIQIGGKPTFDAIWKNLLKFNELCVENYLNRSKITLRLHVTPNNVDNIPELAEMIYNELDPRFFKCFVKNVGKYGGPNDSELETLSYDDPRLVNLRNHMDEKFNSIGGSGAKADKPCYAATANGFVVRSDGRLGKCTVALNNEKNIVGKLGENGTLDLDKNKNLDWIQGVWSGDMKILRCPLHSVLNKTSADHPTV